ncbi:beta-N-acetylhexosaminidase [Pseudalkalibacillus sp. Hm43]|uniref:beta-N-acetylhexosaminidase n=1 Tax=Pseudalkalibacillus sp. Hm43 TaxID=3450742 RepID=UPI003F444CAB
MKRSYKWLIGATIAGILLLLFIFIYMNQSPMMWSEVQSDEDLDDFIKQMSTEEKVGQLLMPAIREMDGEPVTEMNDELNEMLGTFQPGGIILFRENIQSRNQVKQLNEAMQKGSDVPLLISIDQEGGIVTRLPYFPELPGNMALGATHSADLARETGEVLGAELRQIGVHIDFTPSVDVNTNPNNPVIGVRSFGDDPELVTEMGLAFMEGLHASDVMAVAKHFPGHGSVNLDSHYVLPVSEQSIEELEQVEWKPFRKMIEQGVPGIMTAHITFPNIDDSEFTSRKDGLPIQTPATMSPKIMNELLRNEMGFQGLLFTDSMEMKAITDHFGPGEAAVQAVLAGVDVIVMPDHLKVAYDSLAQAVEENRISEERLNQSVNRILQAKLKWIDESEVDELDAAVTNRAVELEKKIAQDSITLMKNEGSVIPLTAPVNGQISFVSTNSQHLEKLKYALWKDHKKVTLILLKGDALTEAQKQELKKSEMTILITDSKTVIGEGDTGWEQSAMNETIRHSEKSILVMARNPYDADVLSEVDAAIAQYSDQQASFQATVDLIFGRIEAKGERPVERLEKR